MVLIVIFILVEAVLEAPVSSLFLCTIDTNNYYLVFNGVKYSHR